MRHRRALELAYANGTYIPPSARPQPPEKPLLHDAYLMIPRSSVEADGKLPDYMVRLLTVVYTFIDIYQLFQPLSVYDPPRPTKRQPLPPLILPSIIPIDTQPFVDAVKSFKSTFRLPSRSPKPELELSEPPSRLPDNLGLSVLIHMP